MDSKLFAVIDTNVLVSALISTNLATPPLVVITHVYSGDIDHALQVFLDHGLNLDRTKVADETFSDPKDIVFYEVKMSKEDAYLVTGNTRHFPRKPFVITPREMVEILEKVD